MLSGVPDTGKDAVFGDSVFAFKSAGKVTAPEVKLRFHFMCDMGLPGLLDLVIGADVNTKGANGICVDWVGCQLGQELGVVGYRRLHRGLRCVIETSCSSSCVRLSQL